MQEFKKVTEVERWERPERPVMFLPPLLCLVNQRYLRNSAFFTRLKIYLSAELFPRVLL